MFILYGFKTNVDLIGNTCDFLSEEYASKFESFF